MEDDLIDLNEDFSRNSFTGRNSLPFSCGLEGGDFGKESLGLLNDSLLIRDSLAGRDSLASLFGNNGDDFGRESLGILPPDVNHNFSFDDVDFFNSQEPLNVAFINSYPLPEVSKLRDLRTKTISQGSSISPYSSVFPGSPSFQNLSQISKIYSLSKNMYSTTDLFNNAFLSKHFSRRASLGGNFVKAAARNDDFLKEFRIRVQSLPETLKVGRKIFPLEELDEDDNAAKSPGIGRKYWNTKESLNIGDNNNVPKETFSTSLLEMNSLCEPDNDFNDSVFIEASHVAEKMADDSIWEEKPDAENLLDSTPQPDWNLPEEEKEAVEAEVDGKNDKVIREELLFKKVDKLLQPLVPITATSSEPDPDNGEMCVANDRVSSESGDSKTANSKTSNCSKSSAKELLQNLSEILIKLENRSSQQKSEGLSLLHNLAHILNQSDKNNHLDDSGHSSLIIEQQQHQQQNEEDFECFEVLDLRVKNSPVSEENINAMDLSMASKTQGTPNRRLSQSFSFPGPSAKSSYTYSPLRRKDVSGTSSTSSLDASKNKSNTASIGSSSRLTMKFGVKLKSKKIEEKTTKGPLKAVIPLGNMAKGVSHKVANSTSKPLSSIKTSTPLLKSKLKPMAQSTPENRSEKHLNLSRNRYSEPLKKNSKLDSPSSPVSTLIEQKHVSNLGNKSSLNNTTRSGSTPNLLSPRTSGHSSKSLSSSIPLHNSLNRRRSAGDIKPPAQHNASCLRQTNSNASKIQASAGRTSVSGRKSGIPEKSEGVLSDNRRASAHIKPLNLLSKLNKQPLGKENSR